MKSTSIAFALLLFAVPSFAGDIHVESGGITLNWYDTSTAGDISNPWIINENMTSAGVLEFEANATNEANPLGNNNAAGTYIQLW